MAANSLMKGAQFYRRWSSRAAEIALTTADSRTRGRCAHSAHMWAMIADAIDGDDQGSLATLTHNLAIIAASPLNA